MKVVSAQAPVFAKVYPSAPEIARRVAVIIANVIAAAKSEPHAGNVVTFRNVG